MYQYDFIAHDIVFGLIPIYGPWIATMTRMVPPPWSMLGHVGPKPRHFSLVDEQLPRVLNS